MLLLAAFGLGCSSTDSSSDQTIGIIQPGLQGVPVIQAPDTVQAGFPFTAVINTFGSSSCVTPDGHTLRQSGSEATVVPFDRLSADQACTRDYGARPHPVQLTFTVMGDGKIVVRGKSVGGTVPGESMVTVTKDVFVIR